MNLNSQIAYLSIKLINPVVFICCLTVLFSHSLAQATETIERLHSPKHNIEAKTCIQCHEKQVTQWQASHHAKSMQQANQSTVLGNFNQFLYENAESWTLFNRDDKGFYIETGFTNQAGKRYRVPFVFGFYPLQQLLVDIGSGRLQAYTIAWDARSKQQGGQKWYDLYDDSHQTSSPFYWKGQFNNWNTRCAQCHSTGLTRGYDLKTDSYDTRWHQPNISCEACHGSAARHLTLQQDNHSSPHDKAQHAGFTQPIKPSTLFTLLPEEMTAKLSDTITLKKPKEKTTLSSTLPQNQPSTLDKGQASQCIFCHSRRHPLVEGHGTGEIHQEMLPRLALPRLYYPDGQIQDEVFVYGSYSQSKMAAAGVVCSHCHDSHSNKLVSQDNSLCTQCHRASQFDNPSHTLHLSATITHTTNHTNAPQCVDCHMPSRTYMGVDIRHDHSFRIPNPWVSEALKTPNVCLSCHKDKNHSWTQQALASKKEAIFLHNSDIGTATLLNMTAPDQAKKLIEKWVLDPSQAPMRRAVLINLLDLSFSNHIRTLNTLANDDEALVQLGVLNKLKVAPFTLQLQIGFGLLYDDNKNVRLAAIELLSPALKTQIPVEAQATLNKVLKEAIDIYQVQQDTLPGQLSLADLAYNVGDLQQAKIHFENALTLQPHFLPAKLNLASIYRETGHYTEAKQLLNAILSIDVQHSLALYNLGLIYVIEKDWRNAISTLKHATHTAPENRQFAFVYLLALEASGDPEQALIQLKKLSLQTPNDPALIEIKKRLLQKH
ncbi:tetratricopeptide repeat protein [uncultured Shewanella sp.]|uniref:tetratricopeptide repeat protein n=1 Tax=uncultured Shewanella sp. TaxID=173975 RepID=UPI002616C6DD|nr:tetratricopeptide repeat protein [uncultured Shewanella sp.]